MVDISSPAIDYYINKLEHPEPQGYIPAHAMLPLFGDLAVEPLAALKDHPSSQVRATAAEILGRIGGRRAVEFLVSYLNDPDPSVVGAAVDGLHQHYAHARPALRRAIKSAAELGHARAYQLALSQINERLAGGDWAALDAQADAPAAGTQADPSGEAAHTPYEVYDDTSLSVETQPPVGLGSLNLVEALKPLPRAYRRRAPLVARLTAGELGLREELKGGEGAGFPGRDQYAVSTGPIFPRLASENHRERNRAIQEAIDLGKPVARPLMQAMLAGQNKTFILAGLIVLRYVCEKNCVKDLRKLLSAARDREVIAAIERTIQVITGRHAK